MKSFSGPLAVTEFTLGSGPPRYAVHEEGKFRVFGAGMSFELHILYDGSGTGRFKDGIIYTPQQAKADAEYMVLSANSYEPLKKALRELLIDAQAQIWDGDAVRDAQALLDKLPE